MTAMDSACAAWRYGVAVCQSSLRCLPRHSKSSLSVLVVATCISIASAYADEKPQPQDVVEGAASQLREQLDGRQDYYAENLDELYEVIDEVLSPVFDIRYSGRLVLGKHWKPSSADQRDRFIAAFYSFLKKTYAKGMLEFDQDKMRVLPAEKAPTESKARVKTVLTLNDGSSVPVNYSLRLSSAGWKVYDVRIEGVSYVQNYRNQFAAEISALGIDAVIERLENEAAKAANVET